MDIALGNQRLSVVLTRNYVAIWDLLKLALPPALPCSRSHHHAGITLRNQQMGLIAGSGQGAVVSGAWVWPDGSELRIPSPNSR